MEEQLKLAKYIHGKIYNMIAYPMRGIFCNCNVYKVLLDLGIQVTDSKGGSRKLMDVYEDLTEVIKEMEGK